MAKRFKAINDANLEIIAVFDGGRRVLLDV